MAKGFCPCCGLSTSYVWDVFWPESDEQVGSVQNVIACSRDHVEKTLYAAGFQLPEGNWVEMREFNKFDGAEFEADTRLATYLDLVVSEIREGEYDGEDEDIATETGPGRSGQGEEDGAGSSEQVGAAEAGEPTG